MVRQSNQRESSDDESSSYSDCRNSSASAPASALNSARIISASKVRAGFARFRDAIPIPIDGPEVESQSTAKKVIQIHTEMPSRDSPTSFVNANVTLHTITSSATVATPSIPMASNTSLVSTIIRPKVLPSTSNDMPIRKPIFIKPSEIESTISKPVITSTKPTICSTFDSTPISNVNKTVEQSPNSSFRTFVPPRSVIASKSKSPDDNIKSTTYGATGPLSGKIITKENLVLTESGITAKPMKPSVPPKPKGLMAKSLIPLEANKVTEEQEKLLAPLESILNDANDLSTFLSQGATSRTKQTSEKRECPAIISVECADQPEVRRLHFLDKEVPYTLTLRNIQQTTDNTQLNVVKNRKSLDLVSNFFFVIKKTKFILGP